MIPSILLAGVLLLAGGESDLAYRESRLVGCFLGSAAASSSLRPLLDECNPESREERRFWLVGPKGAVYLLRLLAPTIDRPLDGQLYLYSRHHWIRDSGTPRERSYCDLLGIDVIQESSEIGNELALDWPWVAARVADWRSIQAEAFGRGRRSYLTLVGEGCVEGAYSNEMIETAAWQPEEQERAAVALRGLILSLGSGEWKLPAQAGSVPPPR